VSGEHDKAWLEVEEWEMELARRIAGTFRRNDEDLAAELLLRLVQLKAKERADIANWRAFLAQSLYNAAKNFIRHQDVLRRREQSWDHGRPDDDEPKSHFEERFAAPPESMPPEPSFSRMRAQLVPEMRKLADLLIDNEGNVSAVAKSLGRPRKTVEYQIEKLRAWLNKQGVEP